MAPKKQSYSRKHRLTRESELETIKQEGKRLRTEHLDVRIAVSLLSYCRVAVIVGKYGHAIVKRNRLRRRIRELARIRLIPFYNGLDVIIKALPNAYAVDFGQLGQEVDQIKMQLSAIAPER